MPSLVKAADDERKLINCSSSIRKHKRAKENVFKLRCSQALRRKLKKYRLRKDGKEDEDVLDVSQSFKVALRIRSPNKTENIICEFREENKNFLFKMNRRKQIFTVSEKDIKPNLGSTSSLQDTNTPANAFKLLMDGRNKSIGGNSPGKEKADAPESIEVTERRDTKAKRLLVLQKMAEAKGSLKNKEIQEYEEECIRNKLDKRAKRLKAMILNAGTNQDTNQDKNITQDGLPNVKKEMPKKIKQNGIKTLNIIDMFLENEEPIKSPERKSLLKEDEDFLRKLSPSLRKKENMLCYFQKINKDTNVLDNDSEPNNPLVIKVKLKPRDKSKRKLSLKKNYENSDVVTIETVSMNGEDEVQQEHKNFDSYLVNKPFDVELIEDSTHNEAIQEKSKKIKTTNELSHRKRKHKALKKIVAIDHADSVEESSRPKRTARKPIKYNDDVFFTSSDEELNVCTPKKKKPSDQDQIRTKKRSIKVTVENSDKQKIKIEKKAIKEKEQKQALKLAPIFNSKSQSILTPEALEAKQKFLQSGVPEKLKKKKTQEKSHESVSKDFVPVVHIQQIGKGYNSSAVTHDYYMLQYSSVDCDVGKYLDEPFKSILNNNIFKSKQLLSSQGDVKEILQNIKTSYPKFPVYRTYQLLKNKSKGEMKDSNVTDFDTSIEIINNLPDLKNESPDQLMWSDKYRPLLSKQIIGNFETVKELKKWLETWTEYQIKKNNENYSDSSDFCASDTDSRDGGRSYKNLLILNGPVGSGKTAAVYAVAAELAIKVIEVNASSRRTGKIMLQDLQEATQSHKVNRGKGSQENSQKSQDIPECLPKKRGRKKKITTPSEIVKNKNILLSQEQGSSQESDVRTCMSLILIDDADIIFEQDDGFCSAIAQLAHSSKRPVILITGSLTCPHLYRFLQSGRILKTNPFIPRMLGTWLDIMCLADAGKYWPGMGAKLLDVFKGDIRKTINYLQFYTSNGHQTSENSDSQSSDSYKAHVEDESSNTSWIDSDKNEDRLPSIKSKLQSTSLLGEEQFSPKIFDFWWNISKALSKTEIQKDQEIRVGKSTDNLSAIACSIDSFSCIDCLSVDFSKNITSDPWYTAENDSVVESENWQPYSGINDLGIEICQYLAQKSMHKVQGTLEIEEQIGLEPPLMAEQRQKDRLVARHGTLTSFLNPSLALDRRSLALDYWSSCRSICRIEKSKADSSSRRNNRFCHYLKTSSILCKTESFDNLCESLKPFSHS